MQIIRGFRYNPLRKHQDIVPPYFSSQIQKHSRYLSLPPPPPLSHIMNIVKFADIKLISFQTQFLIFTWVICRDNSDFLCDIGKYVTMVDRSRNFGTRGHSPGAVEFLGSGVCFDAPSQIPYVFVVRLEKKIHTVHIACWLQLHVQYMLVMPSKLKKNKPKNIFKQGVCTLQSWIRLCV